MRGRFVLGRVFGIRIEVHPSLAIIFGLILLSLGAGALPAWHPGWSPLLTWSTALGASVLFFASVLVHELAHTLVGRFYGIPINSITLFLFGGSSNIEEEPPSARSEFWMAIVGPLTSVLLGFGFLWLGGFLAGGPLQVSNDPEAVMKGLGPLPTLLAWLGSINILIALFNMLPGFPLDGGRVLRSLLWGITGDLERATRWAGRFGWGIGWLLIATGIAMAIGIRIPVLGTGLVSGLWLAFIGWFLKRMATASYERLLLSDVPVRRLLDPQARTVPYNLSVAELIEEHLLRGEAEPILVVDGDRLIGGVRLADLAGRVGGTPNGSPLHGVRAGDDLIAVEAVMRSLEDLQTLDVGADLGDAMGTLMSGSDDQVPVIDRDGHLAGVLKKRSVARWLILEGPRLASARR